MLIVSPTFPFPFPSHAAPNSFPLIWTRIWHGGFSLLGIACMSRVFRPTRRLYFLPAPPLLHPFFAVLRVYSIRSRVFAQEISKHNVTSLALQRVRFMTATDFYFLLLLRLKASPLSLDDKSSLLETLSNQLVGQLLFPLEKLRVIRHTSQTFFDKCISIDSFKVFKYRKNI